MRAESDGVWIDYPEVPESRATGVVADVYAGIRAVLSFVPGLFRSLAVCPGYLELAWAQVSPVLGDPRFAHAASRLADEVTGVVQPPADPAARRLVARYASGRMLLAATGLEAALHGDLGYPAAAPQDAFTIDMADQPQRASAFSSTFEPDRRTYELFGDIRRGLDTPIVNSVWRVAAAEGLLDSAWEDLGPQVEPAHREAGRIERLASEVALDAVPWHTAATPSALRHHGLADATPGVGAILAAYRRTLARVLVLVSSSREGVPPTTAASAKIPQTDKLKKE